MELIRSLAELRRNIDYLESPSIKGGRDHQDFVKRGTCFVAYTTTDGVAFAPSRFLGYAENDFHKHAENHEKDGRDTNPAISEILGQEPQTNPELEVEYRSYSRKLGFEPNDAGTFGVERKFWDLRT